MVLRKFLSKPTSNRAIEYYNHLNRIKCIKKKLYFIKFIRPLIMKEYILTKIDNNIKLFIDNKIHEKNQTVINFPIKKTLMLIACHCDSEIKLKSIINNFLYFERLSENIDFIIINTVNTQFGKNITDALSSKCLNYFEIENTASYDFGKWIYALKNIDYTNYNNIIFTNDSYIIHNNIDFFLYKAATTNVELYGYNDSTQNGYHYQSYLFSLKCSENVINKFFNMYQGEINHILSQQDVIERLELRMIHFFSTSDCYLKLGEFAIHRGLNIFFTSDYLYVKLKNAELLPFTKIKRII